ncbi:preprotein translocase subunit SecA, partial [Amycolatopsis japonica]
MAKLLRFIGVESQGLRLGAADLAAIEATIRDTAGDAKEIPPSVDPGRPDVVAGPPGTVLWPKRFTDLGTSWARDGNGWYRAESEGTVPGPEGPVVVPEGARAVFDAGGEARYVVLKDEVHGLGDDLSYQVVEAGLSVERGLDGQWSAPRSQAGEVRARKMTEAEVREAGVMTLADGSRVLLPPESERVVDRHGGAEKVVAYRQLKDAGGTWLGRPRVFVPDGEGGWVQHAADAVAYEGWLASANRASKAAWTLWDIAARSGPEIPSHRRLTGLSGPELRNLYGRGPEADAFAAVFELIRRNKGIALRWTQVESVHAFGEGEVVNMAAGEGKSWLFFAHAAVNAMQPGVDAVQMTTTRGILADREMPVYVDLLGKLGVDVHRLNQDDPPPGPREGRPTVYVGTAEDVGFTYLRRDILPGQETKEDPVLVTVSIDEIDEALVYSNAQYILSEGVQGVASAEVLAQVEAAHDLVQGVGSDGGWLTEADFGRREGQAGGPARLTDSGRDKVEQRLGHALSDEEVTRVNMAAAARWEYKENVHYVLHEGKIYIIDQTTHNVMFNPATSSESRWNGGLAQAVERKHELQVRSDSGGSKVVTARELLAKKEYGQKTGASGTANGHGMEFAQQGLSPMVRDIDRYYESRLTIHDDVVAVDEAAKLTRLAQDVQAMRGPEGTGQGQVILATRNDQVAMVSELLTGLGVPHEAIDAKWQLEKGVDFEEEVQRRVAAAGGTREVLVINMQGARGVDYTGVLVRVTGHSEISRDIDVQAENRAGRSGSDGEVVYYTSPKDELYQLSQNPDVQLAITTYTDAVTDGDTHAIAGAQQGLRDLVKVIQTGSGHPTIDRTTARPNAPPTGHDTHPRTRGDEPDTRPPRERRDSLIDEQDEDTVAVPGEVLDTAQAAFIEQLDDWRAAHPGVIVPAAVGDRLREAFLNQFRDAYTAGAGQQDWLEQTTAGLHNIFDHAIPARPGRTTPSDQPAIRPPEQPPAAPERRDSLLDDDTVSIPDDVLDTAHRAFTKQLDAWLAAHPDTVLQADKASRLENAFLTGFRAEYTAGQQDWRDWLERAASGLHDIFDHAIPVRPVDTTREWPSIPSDPEDARDWVYHDGGLSQGRFGKSPAKDFEPFIPQATKIVSQSHRVPVWIEQPDLEDDDAVRLNSAVKDLIAKYLANGWSEHDAGKLSAELAAKLGTSRGTPGNPVPLPGGARTDGIPEAGESSSPSAVAQLEIPMGLVGWWPADDGSGPQDLRELLRGNRLLRRAVPWLSEGEPDMVLIREELDRLLAGTKLMRLSPEIRGMIWRRIDLDKSQLAALDRDLLIEKIDHLLVEARLEDLPQKLRNRDWKQVERDLVELIEAWFLGLRDQMDQDGRYLHDDFAVEETSGGLADEWLVAQLRGVARADWHGRLGDDGLLSHFGRGVVSSMVDGFVDAAVPAPPDALPSVRGVLYVNAGDPSQAEELRSAVAEVVDLVVEARLARYPEDAVSVSVEELGEQVDIRIRTLHDERDLRIGSVELRVKGQRPPGGWYGPEVYGDVRDTEWEFYEELQDAQSGLGGLSDDVREEVLARARDIVNQYNQDPSQVAGPTTHLKDLYESRYGAAVEIVAWELHAVNSSWAESTAHEWAFMLSDLVGLRRQHGVLSGGSKPVGWPLIPSDPEEARAWVYYDGGLSRRRFGKSPAKDFEPFVPQATKIVSLSHRVPSWIEQPDLEDEDAVRLNSAVKDLIAKYLANGWSEQDALRLSAELAVKLGTSRGLRAPSVPLPGGARIDENVPKTGESSNAGAAGADVLAPTDEKPVFPPDLVGWRPATDENGKPVGPKTLLEYLREFLLWREIEPRLRDGVLGKSNLGSEIRRLVDGTVWRGKLPLEVIDMVWQEAERKAIEAIQAWADDILNEMKDGGYPYTPHEIAVLSGGLFGEWVATQLWGLARADWQGRLSDIGLLPYPGRRVVAEMLHGFVDAAVQAPPGELPSVRGVLYVAEEDADAWGDRLRSMADEAVRFQVNKYPSVPDLRGRVDIRTRVLPKGDPRIGTVLYHVDKQRKPGGWYGPELYKNANHPIYPGRFDLRRERAKLTGVDREGTVFTQARALVNKHNHDPSDYAGQDPELYRKYRARYEVAVDLVAAILHSYPEGAAKSTAVVRASELAGWVGWRRHNDILSGMSGQSARPGTVGEPGWSVPAGDGVGVVEAGMVLGDPRSPVGLAGAWLQREPGVFGVVVPGRRVPDVETVARALEAAGWNKRDKVRLFLCYQPGLEKLAEDLADLYGVEVFYPKEKLWFGVAGGAGRPAARVEKLEYVDGRPRLTLLEDGTGWAGRKPGGGEEEEGAAYVLTAPARAPRLGLQQEVHLGPQADSLSTMDTSGRHSHAGAPAPTDEKPGKPVIPPDLVGWRPAKWGIGPRNLLAYLRTFWLWREVEPRLRDGTFGKAHFGARTRKILAGMELPAEVREMVWQEAELDLVAAVQAWLADILGEMHPSGVYNYSLEEVAELSGGLVDAWVVWDLRNVARADWNGQLRDLMLDHFGVFESMLAGVVDAAVRVRSGVLPSVRVELCVPRKQHGDKWGAHMWAIAERRLRARLARYPAEAVRVSAEALLDLVDIQVRVVHPGDSRIDTVLIHADGQRPPGGLYDPVVYESVDAPGTEFQPGLRQAQADLVGADREGPVFERARALVNQHNLDPSEFVELANQYNLDPAEELVGTASLHSLYQARYEAAVTMVAWELHRHVHDEERAETAAEVRAGLLADWVGVLRQNGIWGGVSGQGALSGFVAEPGWLVQVEAGVGRVMAGLVLGDAHSSIGKAARWLRRERGSRRERGVFGVVVPGHRVPDVETVARALDRAGWNKRDKLRLFLCYQPGLEKLAQDLADLYNVEVFYPKEKLWLGVAGGAGRPAARVEKLEYIDGRPRLTLLEDGTGWAGRKPGGDEEEEGAAYVLTAPARAPRLGLQQEVHLGPQADSLSTVDHPETGESSRSGAVRAGKPLVRAPLAPAELVEWRPVVDANGRPIGPQTLPEFLREFIRRRGIANRLRPSDFKEGRLDEDVKRLLRGTRLGTELSRELLELVRQEVVRQEAELDPLSFEYVQAWRPAWVTEWFKAIVDDPEYSDDEVAEISGGWVDRWVVEQSREYARMDWMFRLNDFDEVATLLLEGFVDAAVQAEPGALPRLLGVRYVAEETPGRKDGKLQSLAKSLMPSILTAAWSAKDPLHRLIKEALKSRLKEHRMRASSSITVSVEDLLAQTDIRTRVVPAGDPRVDIVHLHVEGQQLLGGLYGLGVYDDPSDEASPMFAAVHAAHSPLLLGSPKRRYAAFKRAPEVVNQYNREPVEYTGQNPLVRELYRRHRARYEALVTVVATELFRHPAFSRELSERAADERARELADWVGLRRRHGVVGDVSGVGLGSGWLVPVSARVGVVEAGMVLGDLGSQVGRAARWLRAEPGVFGVVVTGHTVPDIKTVVRALGEAGWNGTDSVRLFLCYQEGLPELAERLAAYFRSRGKVFYPGDQVWFGVAGGPAAGVGRIEYVDGKPQVKLADNGEGWIEEDLSGKRKTGTYVLPASAEAPPLLGLLQPLHLGPQTGSPVPDNRALGALAADEAPDSPRIPEKLVGWEPAEDGPQTVRDYLREHVLLRRFVPWLSDAEPGEALVSEEDKLVLAGTPVGELSPGLRDVIRKQLEKTQTIEKVDRLLAGTRLGDLPIELLEMVFDQVRLTLEKAVWEWFDDLKDKEDDRGEYLYGDAELELMSGGLIDEWVVEELRKLAREDWWGLLSDDVMLEQNGPNDLMLNGFVDAAVRAQTQGEVLPSVRGVLYAVEEEAVTRVNQFRSTVERKLRSYLVGYPPGAVSVEALMARVDIRARVLGPEDSRIEIGALHVEGQRSPNGWYGPTVYENGGAELAKVDDGGDVYAKARALVNKYNLEDSEITEKDPYLQLLRKTRYDAAVLKVAETLDEFTGLEEIAEEEADAEASSLAGWVGWRRQNGIVSGAPARGARPVSGVEPGWLVPVRDGVIDGVGVVEAGMVWGDVGSKVALAGAWLPHERDVFGVVVTGHRVPDMETLVRALWTAGWNGSDEVRLFLCYQEGLAKLAGDLANQRGVVVSYPEEQVLLGPDGDHAAGRPAARVGKLAYARDGSPLITARDNGEGWIRKKPRGQKDERGTYTLTAPAQAPHLGLTEPIHLGPQIDTSLVSEKVVNWRPPADESKPQTLKEFLVRRGVAYGLVDGRLSRLGSDGVRRGVPLGADVANLLGQQPLSKLPPELWEMVLREVALEPASVSQAEAWLDKIKYEMLRYGGYRYSSLRVAEMSGGLVDAWVVEELRLARAHWQGRLNNDGTLSRPDSSGVVALMLRGFVDAAVRAPSGELPSVQWVFYVSEGAPDPVLAVHGAHRQAMETVKSRLNQYPPGVVGVSAGALGDQVHIRTEVVSEGDTRIGTAQFDVSGQRPPGGLFGPAVYWSVDNPSWTLHSVLQRARVMLAGLGSEEADALFTRARGVVNRYNLEPGEVTGPSLLRDLYEARYEAAVAMVADVLSGGNVLAEARADEFAAWQADMVGPRRLRGVVGVGPVPVSEGDVRAWPAVKLGHLVPVADGVGRIRAGMVLGDLDSPAG